MGVPSERPKRSVTTSGTPPRPVLLGVAHGVEDAHVGGGNLESSSAFCLQPHLPCAAIRRLKCAIGPSRGPWRARPSRS
jgi:hypothetical protein